MNNPATLPILLLLLCGFAVHPARAEVSSDGELFVGKIVFRGNQALGRRALLKEMQLRPSGIFSKTPYSFTLLTLDIEALHRRYHSRGFLDASVNIAAIEPDPEARRVAITLDIEEGVRWTVDSIFFVGNRQLDDSDLEEIVTRRPGDALNSEEIALSVQTIRDALRGQGHLLADVESSVEPDTPSHSGDIVFSIREGPAVFAGDLDIVGLDAVRREAVIRELRFEDRKPMSTLSIGRSIRNLYATGLFNLVLVEPQDTLVIASDHDTAVLPVLVQVQETDPLALQAGGGYNFTERFFFNVGVAYRNLLGLGHRISLTGRVSGDVRAIQLAYRYPWLGGIPLTADWSGYVERRTEETFEATLLGVRSAFTGRLGYVNAYRFWNRLERVESLDEPPSTAEFPTTGRRNTFLVGAGLSRDTREDVLPSPLAISTYLEAEIAGPEIWASNQFYRFQGAAQLFFPLVTGHLRANTSLYSGYMDGYGAEAGRVPANELFRPGREAVPPVRGYAESELSEKDELGNVRGNRFAMVFTPLEVTFPIYAILRGAVFLDGGVVRPRWGSIDAGDLHWGAGPGLRITVPLGTIRIDYGIKLGDPSDRSGRLHLSVGVP